MAYVTPPTLEIRKMPNGGYVVAVGFDSREMKFAASTLQEALEFVREALEPAET